MATTASRRVLGISSSGTTRRFSSAWNVVTSVPSAANRVEDWLADRHDREHGARLVGAPRRDGEEHEGAGDARDGMCHLGPVMSAALFTTDAAGKCRSASGWTPTASARDDGGRG